MNAPMAANDLNLMKFGIGQPVPRQEDPTLLRGEGRYTDDMSLPNQAWCVMVRSQVAHGVIKAIDTAEAKSMPGVLGVWTGADLANYGPLRTLLPVPNRDGSPMKMPTRPSLATDKVRFAAIRWPSSSPRRWPGKGCSRSRDGRIAPCPPSPMPARQPSPARRRFDDAPGTSASTISMARDTNVAEAFAKAGSPRGSGCQQPHRRRAMGRDRLWPTMTPRRRYTLRAGNQVAFGLKHQMADLLKAKPNQMRVLTGKSAARSA